MKKMILLTCTVLMAVGLFAKAPVVTEKIVTIFNQTFIGAEDVMWSNSKNIYIVKFTHHGIRTTVRYDADGNFLSSLRYYTAERLPLDIQVKLKQEYEHKNIFVVTEYVIGDNINYYVKLEDELSWITVKVDNSREIEVTENYKKL
jgi:hypothetical protein